jgi:hypothetical protein
MDQEREQERQTYRLCRLAFALLSVALVIASLMTVLQLPRHFGVRAVPPWITRSAFWSGLDASVVWLSLAGYYLLWGRWSHPGWQRRTGLLVVMGMVDAVLWLIDHGDDLGLRTGRFGHEWVRHHLGQALGWAEFALMASLSGEMLVHLGVEAAAETGKATRSLAKTGAAVWMLLFCQSTAWHRWPLGPRPFFNIEWLLLDLGSMLIWTITLIQVTALVIAAARQCGRVLEDMNREDAENDPLRLPSEREFANVPGDNATWGDGGPWSSPFAEG